MSGPEGPVGYPTNPIPQTPPPPPPQETGVSLSDQQVEAEAERILDVGDQFWTDDYDARMDEFARTAETLDADSAARLFQEIRNQDSGAFDSWLQGDRLLSLNEGGRISDAEMGAVVEAFAGAYNNDPDFAGESPLAALSFLDSGVHGLTGPMMAPDGALQNIDRLLAAGDSPEIDQFRESVGRELLDNYTLGDFSHVSNGEHAALAVHLMSEAEGDPTMAARIFGSYGAEDRGKILDDLAMGSDGFGVTRDGEAPADPLSQLITEVAAKGYADPPVNASSGAAWGDIATEIVHWSRTAEDPLGENPFYDLDNQPRPERAEAMARLFNGHSETILDNLTAPSNANFDVSSADPDATVDGMNGAALGNLMRMTVLDGGSYSSQVASDLIADYIGQQHELAAAGDGTAIHRLSMIGGAAQDAVQQLDGDIQADRQAREAFVGFIADIALSAIPVAGGVASGRVSKALEDAFGPGLMTEVRQQVGGNLINTATGELTSEAKQAIVEQLGSDDAAILDAKGSANVVLDALFANAGESYYNELDIGIGQTQDEIAEARQ